MNTKIIPSLNLKKRYNDEVVFLGISILLHNLVSYPMVGDEK